MVRAALDTNVLLRLIVPDVPEQHARARRLLATPSTTFMVADYVFVELVFVLERHYGFDRGQIARAATGIMELGNIECHEDLLRAAIEFWQVHPKLSFEDCLMAEYAQTQSAVPLWTFDHKLANQHIAAEEVPVLPNG
ncbi:MAG: PIN domain-containing protein [Propionibacteriaceae bacterium]|nr:PIN domain-containing protein [Propionibacteriaceae bacterium]